MRGALVPLDRLSDAEADAAVSALAALIGEDAHKAEWRRRLGRLNGDGPVIVAVRHPNNPLPAEYRDQPWATESRLCFNGLAFETKFYELAEGVPLLRDPEGPEAEVNRRLRLNAEYEAQGAARTAERERQRIEAGRREREEAARLRLIGLDEWNKLPPWSRALYAAALKVRDRDPELAADLRAVAAESSRGEEGPSFPGVSGWRGQ